MPHLAARFLPHVMLRLLPLAGLALLLAACDASAPETVDASADLDDAATVLASAVAIDAGGVLEDAAAGAALAATASGSARTAVIDRRGCRAERTYDTDAGLWTAVADCERGDPDGRFYASFERTATYRFLDADGQPQETRPGAVAAEYDILSGTSLFQSPRGVHALTSLAVDLEISDLDQDLVTVDGTVQRAATDTLRGRRGERTLAYTLDATLDGVQGPRVAPRRWRRAVDGTITGSIQATITRTPAGGETSISEVDRTFTIEFPLQPSGDRIAEIRFGDRLYRADVDTGEIAGLTD